MCRQLFFLLLSLVLCSSVVSTSPSDSYSLAPTDRVAFAIDRVFNIVRRIKRFAALGVQADPQKLIVLRRRITFCANSIKELAEEDDPRSIRTLISSLVSLLEWIACTLK